ncbi:MAG TPA: 4,5-dihydroxyphthalate decarboxylase [Patescibacteria group bacterium]|nr:4,5-dihydroxyphthalate decarboxylase [Patescibacteria group bacterium]
MPDIDLTLAARYYDHLIDLVLGKVRVEGVRLTTVNLPVEEIFFRMHAFHEWDICEFSMAKYTSLVASGTPPYRAIPVFPSRVFRQSAVFVPPNSGITNARDLAGRRVGIPEWAQTAGIYARGYLQHQCGLRLGDVHWVQAGVNQPGRKEKAQLSLPPGVSIEKVDDRSLNDMFVAGDIDAIISAREPRCFVAGDPCIVRLWPDYRVLEEAYYRETGIFPIMHAIVIKTTILERHPWIAMNLFKAFDEAKNNSLQRVFQSAPSQIPVAWSHHASVEVQKIFGEDCWPYGIEPNRRTLDGFLDFCCEQGVTPRRVQIDELFPREVTQFYKV